MQNTAVKISRSDSAVCLKFDNDSSSESRNDSDGLESIDLDEEVQVSFLDEDQRLCYENVTRVSAKDYINVLTSADLVCLIYLRFIALFCQTFLETIVPPVMQKYFDLGDQANSFLYLLGGIMLIIVFIVLSFSTKYMIPDRNLVI